MFVLFLLNVVVKTRASQATGHPFQGPSSFFSFVFAVCFCGAVPVAGGVLDPIGPNLDLTLSCSLRFVCMVFAQVSVFRKHRWCSFHFPL